MKNWKDLRAEFPALERQVWVNAAACSPLPLPVYEAAKRQQDDLLLSGDRNFGRWLEGVEEARALLAQTIGGSTDEIAFTPNTSHSMNLVAALLRAEGVEEVVTLGSEFPATTLPLIHHGLRLRFVEPVDGLYDPAAIAAACAGAGALVVSHVQFALGTAVDLPALGAIARQHGCRFVINATQSLGARPVDVRAAGADFLVATGHKWLCAGFGTGMFWGREELLSRHRFPFAGWLSVENAERMDNRSLDLRRGARAAEVGTFAFDAPLRIGAALRLLGGFGFDAIHERIVSLTDELRAGLRAIGLQPLTPDDHASRSGTTSFAVAAPEPFVAALAARGVIASPRRGSVRIALHAYNDERDLARTLAAIAEAAR